MTFKKKLDEKDHELHHALKQNESFVEQLRELRAKQESELRIAQNREDEFSKAFQQEFDANKVLRAKCTELQNQLDSALDTVDVSQARSQGEFEGVRMNPPFSQDNPRNASL